MAALTAQQLVMSRHGQLTEQVQSLLLVPTLCGVMSRRSRDAQAAVIAISERHDSYRRDDWPRGGASDLSSVSDMLGILYNMWIKEKLQKKI